ncbi:MAG: AAA family ATPase [Simkaniaceae bacterium]|nr:AAA family ATPase [Simkaniaceae bacterium]
MTFAEIFAQLFDQGEVLKELMEASQLGHLYIPYEGEVPSSWPVVSEEGRLYLKRNYFFEESIVENLMRLWDADVKPLDILLQPVMFLVGGPGTGKSYTIRQLIERLPKEMRVVVAAPTGKAAARLGGQTLHAALGVKRSRDFMEKIPYLPVDLLIVDEASMIDAAMWSYLLKALPTSTRLLLVGDPHQLPPVEAGTIFADLCDYVRRFRKEALIELTHCYRTDRLDILDMAEKVKRGEMIPFETEIGDVGGAQVLSSLKKGAWGIHRMNEFLGQKREEVSIILTENDDTMGIYNGMMGVLRGNRGYLEDGRVFKIGELPKFDKAYCLSIHKSQGSEYDEVVVLLPPGSEVFGREILYTALTRAKQKVRLISSEVTLRLTLNKSARRLSHVIEKLELWRKSCIPI